MRLTLDLILAGALVLSIGIVLLAPRVPLALITAALAAAWWPANNKTIEGSTLVVLSTNHGITTSDLLGIAGAAVALFVLVIAPDTKPRRLGAVSAGLVMLGIGIAISFLTG